jgi:hypothetical protein
MMHVMWYIDIVASIIQAVITALLIRNYLGIGFTRLGKMLISLSSILMAESVLMTFIYYIWALNGLGLLVSLPIMVMTLINVIAVTILYLISKM